jgi:transcriptional regulator with XRE-family HTH domain
MPGTMTDVMPRKKYEETSFGERLQAIRKARSLTQVQLAEAAGTTQRAISYYETEAGFPPAPAVIDLAKALNILTSAYIMQYYQGVLWRTSHAETKRFR